MPIQVLRREFWRPHLVPAAASIASGTLMWLSAAGFPCWWLSFVAWIPLLWACDGVSARRALAYGALCGTMAVFGGFTWMTELLERFAGFSTIPSYFVHLIFSVYHGLMWALPACLATIIVRGRSQAMIWAFPLAWGAVEVLLPQVFEVHIAFFWTAQPILIQSAEWIGATGVSMIMVGMNVVAYRALRSWQHRDRRSAIRYAVGWILIAVAVLTYGAVRMPQIEARVAERPSVKIGVVQGNFGIITRRKLGGRVLQALQRKSAELEAAGAEMIVWGETTYPYGSFLRSSTHDLPVEDRRRVRRGFQVPLAFGLVTRRDPRNRREVWNTALVLDSNDRITGRYDKNYPLWFGEWAPIVDREWYLKTFPNASYIFLGDGPAALEIAGYRFGPLICYEDLLASFTAETNDLGVHAFLAMNNESWFGRSRSQPDHLALSALRAVEHRRPLVRAVNAGISTVVSPTGVMDHALAVTHADAEGFQGSDGFVAEVPMMDPDTKTPYGHLARWWRAFLWIACLLATGHAIWRNRAGSKP